MKFGGEFSVGAGFEHHRDLFPGHSLEVIGLFADAANEVFTGDGADEANKHLARKMRRPYDYSYVS